MSRRIRKLCNDWEVRAERYSDGKGYTGVCANAHNVKEVSMGRVREHRYVDGRVFYTRTLIVRTEGGQFVELSMFSETKGKLNIV